MAYNVQANMATPSLHAHGSDQLKREFLAPAIAGEQLCSIAVTEPDAGSDVAGIRTKAVRDGGDWLISGAKTYITNGRAGRLAVPAGAHLRRGWLPRDEPNRRAHRQSGTDREPDR